MTAKERVYTCFDYYGKRKGCAVLICPEETALLTAKNVIWVRWWVSSDTERIVVLKPLHALNCSVGTTIEVWERRWDWSVSPPHSHVVLVWKVVLDDYTVYPLYLRAYNWDSGEMLRALEEITLNPKVICEELKAALQAHARLFVS